MNALNRVGAALAVAIFSTTFFTAALVPAANAAEADSTRMVEEIIVTTKRGELMNVQEMSEAVSVFTGPALEQEFAVTLEDLNHSIPNTQLEHVGLFQAAAAFSMRGVGGAGIETFIDPSVAVFVDGAYYSRNATALLDLFDIESVTALRGPQGTLYGRNAFAGAVSVRTKRPDLDNQEVQLHLDVGNAGRGNAGLVVNTPLIDDTLAFRLAANYHQLDGFFKNDGVVVESYDPVTATLVTTENAQRRGKRENGELSTYLRPSFRWQASDALRIDLIGEYWKDKGDGTANWSQCYQPGSQPPPLGNGPSGVNDLHTNLGFPCKDPYGDQRFGIEGDGSDPFKVDFNLKPNRTDQKIWSITMDANYDTDIGTFTLILNHRDVDEDITTDTDGFNYDLFSSTRTQDFKSTQAEVRWATTFNDNIDFLAGAFYLQDQYDVQQFLWIFLDSELFGGGGFTRDNPFLSWGSNGQERWAAAGYAQVDWHLNEQWTLNFGGRYTYEKKHDVYGMAINDSNCLPGQVAGTDPCNGVPFSGTDITNVEDIDPVVRFGPVDDNWNDFSPRVGVDYRLNDDIMLFAFWQRAFKSGGFVNNAGSLEVFETPYDDEQVDNYEIGLRSDLWDDRLRVNLNVFYAKYKDLQRSVIRAAATSTGQETFTDNAADAESYGVETSFSLIPIDNLTLFGNVGYLHIEYENFVADITGSGTVTDNSDLDLARAPKWDLNVGATYEFDLVDNMGTLLLSTSMSYTDDMVLTTPNDVGFYRDELTTYNASATWESPDSRYRFSLWGKNLSDNTERLGGTPVGGLFAFASPTQPRQYGATFVVTFLR